MLVFSRDLIQLNMLYEQSKRNVKLGVLPVPLEQAKELAAIQLQITLGDHRDDKHSPGSRE